MQTAQNTIILYNPKAVFFDMPLALIAIGSRVCENHKVVIIDARLESEESIDALLEKHLPDTFLVGVTSLTGAPLLDAIRFTNEVRKKSEKVLICWGGWHTSLFPERILQDVDAIDVAVQGQGEETFFELVQSIRKGTSLHTVSGVVFREGDQLIKTKPRAMVDMNAFERLNYDLIDVERYFEAKGRRQFDFITSIGCFFRCTFCADPFVFNRKYSGLLPDRVAEDIAYYYEKYRFEDLNFQDETFFTYRERILEMAQLLINAGSKFTWAATMRADQGSRMSYAEFELCKSSGLRRLLIGVESGSQEMMDWLKKDIKLEQVLQCATWCKELGISVIFPFIVGFPGESNEIVEETKKVIRMLAMASPKFETPIFYFKPYPGTKITDEVVARGEYVLPETLSEWAQFDYIGSKGPWVSEEKFAFFERYKFYLRLIRQKRTIWRMPILALARWRVKTFSFSFPIEKRVIERMVKRQRLS